MLLLIVTLLGCLSFTVQDDAHVQSLMFSHSSAEGGKFLCDHLKSKFNMWTNLHDFVTLQQVWKPFVVQYATGMENGLQYLN